MSYYRHYKNKPYKYVGEARHSETLEEVVIYETLYENDLGKIWVRPKQMFFENVQLEGRSVPRFGQVPIVIEEITTIAPDHIEALAPIGEKTLGQWNSPAIHSRLKNHTTFHLGLARVDDQVVGFKLGYELDGQKFYSWLGGVTPELRGLGIASALMKCQHDWCRRQGYKRIHTKTQNRFREMLILNLKHGFEISGCHNSKESGFKVVLEKRLDR